MEGLEAYAAELWYEVDEAMSPLWESNEERLEAMERFEARALLLSAIEEIEGAVRFGVDSEADVAAERMSALLSTPAVGVTVFGDLWCKLVAFDDGESLGWLFWVNRNGRFHPGEVLPAAVDAALRNGGWVGDLGVFESFVSPSAPYVIRDVIATEWDDACSFARAVEVAFGFQEMVAARGGERRPETGYHEG